MIFDLAPCLDLVQALFAEYAREISIEIDERDPRYELILVAMDGTEAAGCVAMRPSEAGIAEMKRLYVRPAYRGSGLGRRMTEAVVKEASTRGYGALRLDSLATMTPAIRMYESLGFQQIAAYHENWLPGMVYFELKLSPKV